MAESTNILITKCKNNDRRAQYQLFENYLPYVNVIVRRYLFDHSIVKDVVQEVFIIVFKNLKTSFDSKKGEFKPWLRRITINHCIKQNKKERTFDELNIIEHEGSVQPVVFDNFNQEDLMKFLQKMPENYRVVFNLVIIDDLSHVEVAECLGISEISSRKKLSRARDWIKRRIQSSTSFYNIS